MDDETLGRMAGVQLVDKPTAAMQRRDFWEGGATPNVPAPIASAPIAPIAPSAAPAPAIEPSELRVAIAPNVTIAITLPDDAAITSADLRAIRAAAAPLLEELARRRLATHDDPTEGDKGGDV
jgi:hypothetical protein